MVKSSNHDATVDMAPFSANQTQQILDALSHDLRGPVRQMKSFAQLLAMQTGSDADAETVEYVAHINAAADVALQKVDALTRLGAIVATELNPAPCQLADVVTQALERSGIAATQAGPSNAIRANVVVLANRNLLIQVFAELIENSLKFGEPDESLKIESRHESGRCLVTVADGGPGFEAKDPMSAFDLFRRFHGPEYSGTGLGLTVVRTILQRHGSTVGIATAPSGTTLQFSLPVGG